MVTINASPERSLQLGYAGEDKVTKVIFPYDESWLEYGDGEFFIRVLRPGDTEPYNAQDVTNDSEAMTLTLVVTDVELSRQGYGQMQVVYIGPQVVKKSRIYAYRVSKAIDEPVDPPDGSIINEVVRSLAELTDEVGDISTALEAKADKAYVDENLAEKVSDVQINGTSVVTDGVAEIPIAANDSLGVVKVIGDATYTGIGVNRGLLYVVKATYANIKSEDSDNRPIVPSNQHAATFYGLAKVAGYDEKLSTLPVGKYSDEAKVAIQKMLGIYEAPWELIKEDTFTNEEVADHVITTDANGNAFELTDAILLFETPKQETEAKFGGTVRNYFYDVKNWIANETYTYTQSSNSTSTGIVSAFEQRQKMLNVWSITRAAASNFGGYSSRYGANFGIPLGRGDRVSYALLDEPIYCYKISILQVIGTGHYILYGKRKWI